MRILKLDVATRRAFEVANGASLWTKLKGRLLGALGSYANTLGIPGAVAEVEIFDQLVGQRISIRNGAYFTIVSVDYRDYYFHRLTGKIDGTGYHTKC